MPKWIQDQALPTKDECPFTGWGSSFQAKCEVTLPFQLTQFAPNRKIEHPVFLSESGSDSPTSPDMILGCNLICKLGLDLKFNDDTPAIIWEDVEVPMVPGGHWTPAQIDEAFTTILELPLTLRQAETNFEEKSPKQQQALWHIVKKHSVLFSGKLGNLPCKPVHPKLTNFWMQKRFIQHLCPLLYDIINRKRLIVEIYKMTEFHVDLIGPWIIPQCPSKSPELSAKCEATASSPRVNYD
jgi:hypothetical protein